MSHRKLTVPFLTLAAATVGLLPEPTAPAAGPGGVIQAMRKASAALDAGDAATLAACFAGDRTPRFWVETTDGEGRMAMAESDYALTAVDAGGKAFEVSTLADFGPAAVQRAGAVEGRTLTTELTCVRADCASAECSYAVADAARTYVIDGKEVVRHLRITALMRYDDSAFRIFHWHESTR